MSEPTTTDADLDGDGVNDSILIDSDGDGFAETVVTTDPSGGTDVLSDSDGDGIYDTVTSDTDGDGVSDTVEYDVDADGVVDMTGFDTDEDGQVDVVDVAGHTLYLDSDGNVVDQTDTDDDAADQTDTGYDADTGFVPSQDADPDTETDGGAGVDPAEVEREDDAQNWFEQSEDGFCAPSSVAMIVAEYSDQSIPDESAFVQRAIDLGFLTYDQSDGGSWSGLTVEQTRELLQSFGVEATVENGSVDSLQNYLDNGYNAIVAIDSSEVWYGEATGQADHAVVVSSIENGMVYLDDPGTPDGQLEAVPIDVFEKAWEASGDQMVVTDNPDTSTTGEPGVGPDVDDDPETAQPYAEESDQDGLSSAIASSQGSILLPIVLSGDAVAAWHDQNG